MAKFSKGQYVVLMAALSDAREEIIITEEKGFKVGWANALLIICRRIADALTADNPSFDHSHFLAVTRGAKKVDSSPFESLPGHEKPKKGMYRVHGR